jgi:Spy/CpxP family protein refolding chaperone
MSDHDPEREKSAPAAQGERPGRRGRSIVAAIAGVGLLGVFAGSPVGLGLGHGMLAHVPGMTAAAAPFESGFGPGFGPGLAADWHGGLFDGMIEAVVQAHLDRAVRHLSIEIDATAEQQDKLRAIVRDVVKDLLPVREKIIAARATGRELLTQPTIDRVAIEKFRTDLMATHDAVSRRLVQAVADAAEVLTPEQRRKVSDMVAAHRGHWGAWGHGSWGHWGGWRN